MSKIIQIKNAENEKNITHSKPLTESGRALSERARRNMPAASGGILLHNKPILSASKHMKSEKDRDFEDFEYLFPEGQVWFSPKEVGDIIGRSDQFVRNSFHTGKIMGHQSNGAAAIGEEKRTYMRVHRKMLILYLLETANYTSEMFLERLSEILGYCSRYQLAVLEKRISELMCGRRMRR